MAHAPVYQQKIPTAEEHAKYIREGRELVRRLRNPTLYMRIKRLLRPTVQVQNWLWPGRLIRFIWLGTLGRWIFVKVRSWDTAPEAATMRFVRAHTAIPVPRPLLSIWIGSQSYLFMERIFGCDLSPNGYRDLDDERRATLLSGIRDCVAQLRALPPPRGSTKICNVLGGSVFDHRLCYQPYGPYEDEAQMNIQIRHCTSEELALSDFLSLEQRDLIRRVDSVKHQLRFTHGDLAPRNIIIDLKDGRLLALIDWECAGWFPEHWEYLKTMYANSPRTGNRWCEDVTGFLDQYDEEVSADLIFGWGPNPLKYVFETQMVFEEDW